MKTVAEIEALLAEVKDPGRKFKGDRAGCDEGSLGRSLLYD
ncbi:MAG TPA: hypothetical protein PKD45_11355 [Flavobacteriales bacterium]|nr:hypothetical protein [Flavobacteriales bacterium]